MDANQTQAVLNGTQNLRGEIRLDEFNQIVVDYLKETLGIEVTTLQTTYLPYILSGQGSYSYFKTNTEFPSHFDLTPDDFLQIAKKHFAGRNIELTSGLKCNGGLITFTYNPVKPQMDPPFIPDITLTGSTSYDRLNEIIIDYYAKKKGINITSLGTGYLRSNLVYSTSAPNPVYSRQEELGTTQFPITKPEVDTILNEYMSEHGYELIGTGYGDAVGFKYKLKGKNTVLEEAPEAAPVEVPVQEVPVQPEMAVVAEEAKEVATEPDMRKFGAVPANETEVEEVQPEAPTPASLFTPEQLEAINMMIDQRVNELLAKRATVVPEAPSEPSPFL